MEQGSLRRGLVAAGGVVWLFAILLSYYFVHRPLEAQNVIALLDSLANLGVAALLVAAATAAGRRLLAGYVFASPLQALVLRAGLGLGVFSFATLALGAAGLVQPIVFWALLLASVLLNRNELAAQARELAAMRLPIEDGFQRLTALVLAGMGILMLLLALTPPIAWDAQTYHLVEGKLALASGRIGPPPDIPYFSFPSLVEMLYLAALALKGDIVTQLLHLAYGGLLFLALFDAAWRWFSPTVAWVAAGVLVSTSTLLADTVWPYNDAALAFYAFAALALVLHAREQGGLRWFVLAGVFGGLAMGVKYTAAIVPAAILLILLLERAGRVRFGAAASFAASAGLTVLPWLVRNLAFTGNPVYPFLLGGRFWDPFRAFWFSRFGTGLAQEPLRLLVAPWEATMLGQEGGIPYEATIGPLMLVLLPFSLLTLRKDDHHARPILIFGAVLYAFWLYGVASSALLIQTRLLFPTFPALALLSGVALERLTALDLRGFSLARFARMAFSLVLVLGLVSALLGTIAFDPGHYLAGQQTRADFLQMRLSIPGYTDALAALDPLPQGAKVLFLWEPRSYYAETAAFVQPDSILDAFAHLRWKYGDSAHIRAALQQEGYTHVLLNRAGLDHILAARLDPVSADDMRVLQELLAEHAKLIYGATLLEFDANGRVIDPTGAPYVLYELLQAAP